jgi:hypothetical protein
VATIALGRTGEFSRGKALQGKKPYLKLANDAFDYDPTTRSNEIQFSGGGGGTPTLPATFRTILHEIGHAVEAEELRSEEGRQASAVGERDAARKHLQDQDKTFDADLAEAKKKGKLQQFYKEREKSHKKDEEAVDKASEQVVQETKAVEGTKVPAVVQVLKADAATKKAAATNSWNAAQNAIKGLRQDEIQGSAAYAKALEDMTTAITTFVTDLDATKGAIDDLEMTVLQKATDRGKARATLAGAAGGKLPANRALSPLDQVAQAQDAWFAAERVLGRAHQRTRRLQKFIDLVEKNNIQRFTEYSAKNWPVEPGEFYAEAYSLWLVDPHFLRTNYPAVFDFFQNGDYRK